MKKIFKTIIFFAILGAVVYGVYTYRSSFVGLWARWYSRYFPCQNPITYRLGSFDARFGISKETFLKDLQTAEQVWEKPAGRELFTYSPGGALTVNLVYDYRQESTVKLRSLGFAVDGSQSSYNALKKKYETLTKSYEQDKALIDRRINNFQARNKTFTAAAAQWSRQGGNSKEMYEALQNEQADLNKELVNIRAVQAAFNTEVDNINALAVVLNRLGEALNMQVASYNQVQKESSGEFQEGLYKSDSGGTEIDIYQFDDAKKLIKVLAHELGHALGLGHVTSSKAIMYEFNQGNSIQPSVADLTALQQRCRLPPLPAVGH